MRTDSSLEKRLKQLFGVIFFIVSIMAMLLAYMWQFDWFTSVTLLLPFLVLTAWALSKSYVLMCDVLERFGLQLDALASEESNSWHLAQYSSGRVADLKNDFTKLSNKIANKKREYSQTEGFVFEFVAMLDLPIVILDPHGHVYSGNDALLILLQLKRVEGLHAQEIGLERAGLDWQQSEHADFKERFQISSHQFWRSGHCYELLAFFSIENQLRANEQQVWQRLIRVINHEVRNSLTPIYSMSQSLLHMKKQGQLGQKGDLASDMLQVIEKRAQHLLDFVASYSAFSQVAAAQKQIVSSEQINQRLQAIFPELELPNQDSFTFSVDLGQLEQALINLIKNAFEAAGATPPTLIWQQQGADIVIEIIDQGVGINNPDNLFVPFYTTKQQGAGIGLVISRELIRNQGGHLYLKPNTTGVGTRVVIILPC
ncbi:sensor histidine kinase [Pseudoalteromonas tunicata]|uniref:sensor histidine kinase n=1 Tax=Pseudoalteromonas tunicata TaxID=314281 RepID=UPI00273F7749|nr:HAMP domain-containing sensor histidine kinase [Pseudoalteromonas tunicata]MDP4983933.1 HAMP domain-containing histidine kinase [Pseudoalteromonas tunicata]